MPRINSFNVLEDGEATSFFKRQGSLKIVASIIAAIAIVAIVATGGYYIGQGSVAPFVAHVGTDAEMEVAFSRFTEKFQKEYSDEFEVSMRKEIYKQNYLFIQQENAKGNSYTLGETPFMDLTNDEFKSRNNAHSTRVPELPIISDVENSAPLPKSVDFRTKGVVTPVKNQGACGSCWSFSVTGAVESANALNNTKLVSLSEQELVDCDLLNLGCSGGAMIEAFTFAVDNGLTLEADYPYTAKNGKCQKFKPAVTPSSFYSIPSKDSSLLTKFAAQQPVSVTIEADTKVFQLYTSGVITSDACGSRNDHAVLVAGYGTTEDGIDYFLVKNSWGADWGVKGYLNIERGPGPNGLGVCGILSQPIVPSVLPIST
ncbi:cathepsin CPL [Cardiosporidium cionae]|uniref:Cathepsin CPL n=1 Tax=Cardiosporidium cionae TaxID=476202 RepID=A0ABQ7J7K2_9APIC|nr:cathepsin CPL [Cardiosporidium cionae]|eukprot:KAF8819966.1 cathepsin CPL [Cardiosporidium cionae]